MKKDMTLYTSSPVQNLLNAVVVQAAEDHRSAFMKLLRKPDSRHAQKLKKETEAFFLSYEFKAYTRLSGSYLQRKLREEEEETARKIKKTGGEAA